jgi:hypothetical protein
LGRGFALATFRSAYEAGVAAARGDLGPAAFAQAWSIGRHQALDEALTQAVARPDGDGDPQA